MEAGGEIASAESGTAKTGRRRAFETNLAINIEEILGPAIPPLERSRLIGLLGEAHEGVRHVLDARASIGLSAKRIYTVLQLGARLRTRRGHDAAGPLAEQVMDRLPEGVLEGLDDEARARLAQAIELSEIRTFHPLDWRPRMRLGRFELYANLLAGRDRRRGEALTVSRDRRVPAAETAGLGALTLVAVAVAGVGCWFLVSAAAGIFEILGDPVAARFWRL